MREPMSSQSPDAPSTWPKSPVRTTPGCAATDKIWLPQADTATATDSIEAIRQEPPPGTSGRVLLVDDDELVRETLAAQLEAGGHSVLTASCGEDALALLRTTTPVDILVSDLAMQGINGLTLIQEAQRLRSRLPAILLTGYAEDATALAVGGAVSGSYSLIRKPASGAQLADRIAAMLEPAVAFVTPADA